MHERTRRAALAALAGLGGLAGWTTGPGGTGTEQDGPPNEPPVRFFTGTPSPTADSPTASEAVDTGEDATRLAARLDGPVTHTPAVDDGTVVVGSDAGLVRALGD